MRCDDSKSKEEYYYCCQNKLLLNSFVKDKSCAHYFDDFTWDLEWFNATDCWEYEEIFYWFRTPLDLACIIMQAFSALGLVVVAVMMMCVKDPKKLVSAHPSSIVGQICLI